MTTISKKILHRWTVARPIEDIAWSPDGKELAVLYYDPPDPYDKKTGKWTGMPSPYPVRPNVSIFDAQTGREMLRFNTSAFDSKIAFSPTGSTIYSISHYRYEMAYSSGDWQKDTLRAFNAKTGQPIKRIAVPSTGVRDNFAVSPDGRLIAADTTKPVSMPLWRDPNSTLDVNQGFVIVDIRTGKILFREKLMRVGPQGPPLFFSADGSHLISNFNSDGRTSDTYINIYSLDNLR